MTEPTQDFPNGEKQKTSKAKQYEGELGNKKINANKLAVLLYGAGEQVLGELEDGDYQPGTFIKITNPKRLIRIQQMGQQGMSLQFLIGDFDLIESGSMNIVPTGWFWLRDQSPESYEAYIGLLVEFLNRKIRNRAAEAGLVLPGVRGVK